MRKLIIISVVALITSNNVHAVDGVAMTRAMTKGLMECREKLEYGYDANCTSCKAICGNALRWVANNSPNPDLNILKNWFDQCARQYDRCNR